MSPELIPEDNSCRTKTVLVTLSASLLITREAAEDKLLGVARGLIEKKT